MARKLVTAAIVSLIAACSFPDVSFGTGDGGGGSAGDSTTHAEGSAGDDATTDGTPGEGGTEGEGGETGPATDGSSGGGDSTTSDAPSDAPYVFEAAADAPACDHDEDGDHAPGATCGGTDCDDDDPRAYTGEPNYLTYTPTPVTKGDWNCDGTVEMEYTVGVTCGALKLGAGCDATSGFSGSTGCGISGSFVQCASNQLLGLCGIGSTTTMTQGCK